MAVQQLQFVPAGTVHAVRCRWRLRLADGEPQCDQLEASSPSAW
jgi:hypothetical protein